MYSLLIMLEVNQNEVIMCQSPWNWEMVLVSSGYQLPRNVGRKKGKIKARKNGQSALLKIFINYLEIHNSENFAADWCLWFSAILNNHDYKKIYFVTLKILLLCSKSKALYVYTSGQKSILYEITPLFFRALINK